jgi:transposase InsO family protein
VTAELNDGVTAGQRVDRKRVAREMRKHAIRGYQRRGGSVRPSRSRPIRKCPTCKRDFTVDAPNRTCLGDITYR